MASLENYGSKCPRCGENTLSELDYYKSGISASTCRRCGFSSLTRTVGKWELSIIGKTILDGKYQHILIGKKKRPDLLVRPWKPERDGCASPDH